MRGIPEFNYPTFNSAAGWLRGQGYGTIFNPADCNALTIQEDYARDPLKVSRECFARDTWWISNFANGVVTLPGWHNSKGAKAEVALALAIGLKVYYLHEMPSGEWYLTEAEDLA